MVHISINYLQQYKFNLAPYKMFVRQQYNLMFVPLIKTTTTNKNTARVQCIVSLLKCKAYLILVRQVNAVLPVGVKFIKVIEAEECQDLRHWLPGCIKQTDLHRSKKTLRDVVVHLFISFSF